MKDYFKSFASRKEAIILTYHSITPTPLPFKISHHITAKIFEQHIRYIAKKYHCISLRELLEHAKENNIQPRSVVITFDDGFANNFLTAFPILKKYNVPATIFIPTKFIGTDTLMWPEILILIINEIKQSRINIDNKWYPLRTSKDKTNAYRAFTVSFKSRNSEFIANKIEQLLQQTNLTVDHLKESKWFDTFRILNWDQIKKLTDSNMITFGSHTINHKRLLQLSENEAAYEIDESKRVLEKHLGRIDYFAYPYGGPETDFSNQHKVMVKKAGYRAIATCIPGTVTSDSDPFQLPRVSITSDCSVHRLNYLLNGGVAFKDGFSTWKFINGFFSGRVS